MKSLLMLVGGAVLLWCVLLGPGWSIQGEQVLNQSLAALGLCLVPAIASLAWITAAKKTPEVQMTAILGGSGVRLAVALGGGWALHESLPDIFPTSFFTWVGIFYVGALTLEISLATRINPTAEPAEPNGTLSQAR
jgi:hypothetical protein